VVDWAEGAKAEPQVRLGGRLSISHWTQDVRGDAVVVDIEVSLVGRPPECLVQPPSRNLLKPICGYLF